MSAPRRHRRDRSAGWRKPRGSVIVDRTSRWGNPWTVMYETAGRFWFVTRAVPRRSPRFDRALGLGRRDCASAIDRAVSYYRRWLTMTPAGREYCDRARAELAGKDLVCWCAEGSTCHADVLMRVAAGGDP